VPQHPNDRPAKDRSATHRSATERSATERSALRLTASELCFAHAGKLLALGRSALQTQQAEHAETLFRQALVSSRDPRVAAEAHYCLGYLRFRNQELDCALAQFRRCLELRSTHTHALYYVSRIQAAQGDDAASVKTLRDILELDSTHRAARLDLTRLQGPGPLELDWKPSARAVFGYYASRLLGPSLALTCSALSLGVLMLCVSAWRSFFAGEAELGVDLTRVGGVLAVLAGGGLLGLAAYSAAYARCAEYRLVRDGHLHVERGVFAHDHVVIDLARVREVKAASARLQQATSDGYLTVETLDGQAYTLIGGGGLEPLLELQRRLQALVGLLRSEPRPA